ncbi:hypothetical protein B0O99DRAFT_683636 [Bisporella sp. PMI_857]|nr:hypothetical protein B0O99DRAFT_683636 [Bisporella sp. PMI_857]
MSHKQPHQGFLNWVAYTRNLNPGIHEIDKRTCPLINCELLFVHADAMLLHVKSCPRLAKGLYRCPDNGKEERIGKCTTNGCHQLQHCKDRIATAVNSLRRRLSPRGSRPRRLAETGVEKQTMSPEMSVVDQTRDQSYPVGIAELSNDAYLPVPELDSNQIPSVVLWDASAELDNLENYTYLSANFVHTRGDPSELDSYQRNTYVAPTVAPPYYESAGSASESLCSNSQERHSSPQTNAVELDSIEFLYATSPLPQKSFDPLEQSPVNRNQQPTLRLGNAHPYNWSNDSWSQYDNVSNWYPQISDVVVEQCASGNKDLNLLIDNVLREDALHNSEQTLQSMIDQSHAWHGSRPQPGTISSMGSGTSSDSLWEASLFSNEMLTSTRQSSVSTLESTRSNSVIINTCCSSPVRFFHEPGMMFEEPDLEDEEVSIFNDPQQVAFALGRNDSLPPCSPLIPSGSQDHIPIQPLVPRKPIPTPSMSPNWASREPLTPDIDYTSPVLKRNSADAMDLINAPPVYACTFCGREFNDKSNCQRHESTSFLCLKRKEDGRPKTEARSVVDSQLLENPDHIMVEH